MPIASRRQFLATGGALASSFLLAQSPSPARSSSLTAGEIIARIKQQVGVPWREKTVDNLIIGSPDTPVRGIATTMMATLDVLERAAAQGKNMIVTHEPTFYLHQDVTTDIQDDPVVQYKRDFCKKNDLVVFRFHDHWHAHHPDGIADGMVRQLGWQKNVIDPADPKKLTFDGIFLAKWTAQIQQTLKGRTLRVLGDPDLPVRHVQASWGYASREGGIKAFSQPGLDVLICGETREWELVEYCQDSIRMGNRKALVVVGHVLSEQGGMILCADWLRTFVSEVPVEFVPATEPFWNPNNPVAL